MTTHPPHFSLISTPLSVLGEGGSRHLERGARNGEKENQPKRPALKSPYSPTSLPLLLLVAPWGEPSSCHFLRGNSGSAPRNPEGATSKQGLQGHRAGCKCRCYSLRFGIARAPTRRWASPARNQKSQHLWSGDMQMQIHSALVLSNVTLYLSHFYSPRGCRGVLESTWDGKGQVVIKK